MLRKSAFLPKWNIFHIVKFQTIVFYLIYFTTLKCWSDIPLTYTHLPSASLVPQISDTADFIPCAGK